jgi:hypothetical protein
VLCKRHTPDKELFETWMISLPLRTEEPAACAMLLEDPRLASLTEALIGTEYRQDAPMSFGYSCGMQHGCMEPGQFHINRIVYTKAVAQEQGGLFYVPGSVDSLLTGTPGPNHGNIEGEVSTHSTSESRANPCLDSETVPLHPGQVELLPTPGTLVMMSTRCYHRVGVNRTKSPRVMVNTRAQPNTSSPDLCRCVCPFDVVYALRGGCSNNSLNARGDSSMSISCMRSCAWCRYTLFRSQKWDHNTGEPWDHAGYE